MASCVTKYCVTKSCRSCEYVLQYNSCSVKSNPDRLSGFRQVVLHPPVWVSAWCPGAVLEEPLNLLPRAEVTNIRKQIHLIHPQRPLFNLRALNCYRRERQTVVWHCSLSPPPSSFNITTQNYLTFKWLSCIIGKKCFMSWILLLLLHNFYKNCFFLNICCHKFW